MMETTQQPISPEALAEWLGVPTRTLAAWRYKGTGPRYLRIGKHVRYPVRDVQAWLDSQYADAEAV